MTVWVPILLLLILVEIWDLFQKLNSAGPGASGPDEFNGKKI